MRLSEKQSKEMAKAAEPLMDWLLENRHHDCQAIVSASIVKLTETIDFTHRGLNSLSRTRPMGEKS